MHCIEWSPTNGALACGGADGRAHLLKPSGELLGRIPDASPEASVDAYDETGSSGLDQSGLPIRALAFSKGSRYLATAGASTEVTIWDLKRKSKFKSLAGHADAVSAVAYSPGDQHVASAGREGRIVLHSPVSGIVVGEMHVPAESSAGVSVSSLHYSPRRRHVLASASQDGAVRVWDTGVRRLTASLSTRARGQVPCAARDVAFSPVSTDVLASATSDGHLVLLDADAPAGSPRSRLGAVRVGASATSVSWRGDGNCIAVGAGDGRIVWIDPRMLRSGGSGSGYAYDAPSECVLYTTAAHVGGPVTSLRWQRAAETGAGAGAGATAAAAATAPARGTGPADPETESTTPARADAFFVVDANARGDVDATPVGLDAEKEIARREWRAAELEEESRKRVERLLSAREAGTPEAAAAAARPSRSWVPTPVPKTLALRAGTGGNGDGSPLSGTAPARGLPGDVPGTLALAEAIAESRRATTSAVRDVHVEILRQMHEMREAQTAMLQEMREAHKDLAREVAGLRSAQREFVRR